MRRTSGDGTAAPYVGVVDAHLPRKTLSWTDVHRTCPPRPPGSAGSAAIGPPQRHRILPAATRGGQRKGLDLTISKVIGGHFRGSLGVIGGHWRHWHTSGQHAPLHLDAGNTRILVAPARTPCRLKPPRRTLERNQQTLYNSRMAKACPPLASRAAPGPWSTTKELL